ncbi:hypothetical protein U9Y48_27985 [Escherichia coli]|uniref:hypothetical protein n=1 Tax=Escherichia coli TaxID=562 RepID=UPI001FCE9D56|nr:hypothetical protein [Escherichia coli]MDT8518252.1 hypothetical protein [Escherichia coli]MDT8542216.1 hypothetical protein [Escherichia coli]MDT8580237.1 hypothetical protein [Escherichia coli]
MSVILFNSRFRSYGAQGVLKKHPFCGAFLVFWGFKFLSIKIDAIRKNTKRLVHYKNVINV